MQRPFPRLPSIVKMQSVRFLLFRRSVLFPSESKLLHISRCLSFSAPTSFSTQNRTSVSYFHRRSFYSDEQILGEESGDSAAKAWFTSDLISEQTDTRPETGDGNVISGFTEKKDSPKEEVVFINCNSAGSGDEENKAKHSLKGFRKEHNSSFARAGRSFAGNKAGSKLKSSYICTECGGQYSKWWGKCPTCNTSDSVKKKEASSIDDKTVKAAPPQRLVDVNRGMCQSDWRIPLDGHLGMEVARVLGGGLVPGSLVLLGGDPGVGKTTLVLQIAAMISQCSNSRGPTHVLYVSGEESIEQMVNRAGRLQIMSEDLYFYSSTEVEIILDHACDLSPIALIVDSIQTVYLKSIIGSAGNISQVKECTLKLQQFAKQANVTVLLIGHVTKTGDIAGPRMLEHMVDVVLYMEGERYSPYRLLRSVKNRFGTTDELGLLEMTKSGIQAVSNPNQMFLSESFSDSDILAGLALAIIVDGSRAFVIEIQALCVSDTSAARHVNGIQASRADMIIAVLMKQAGLKLQDNAIFLNIVSGFKLTETAGDLAIAAAICSSFLEFPIPFDTAFIGEVGLSGELRMVPRMDKRVSAAAKLGFKRCIVPKAALSSLSSLDGNMEIIGCRVLKDVINEVFTPL